MKKFVFAALALASAATNAQTYTCPAEAKGASLTNARMFIGSRKDAHALHGDVEHIEGGTNIRYHLPDEVPRWFVCQYGGKRIDGTAVSGPETIGARESWVRLDPMIDVCDLAVRKGRGSAWTAAAACKRKQPPPPDMM